jgi:hypothetical protein
MDAEKEDFLRQEKFFPPISRLIGTRFVDALQQAVD